MLAARTGVLHLAGLLAKKSRNFLSAAVAKIKLMIPREIKASKADVVHRNGVCLSFIKLIEICPRDGIARSAVLKGYWF
jgi:hypothetical protein